MAFEPGSGEGEMNIDDQLEYNHCSIDDVFNAIQFQVFIIDIRDETEYNNSHIRQAYHINKLKEVSMNADQQLFLAANKDQNLPIYIYDQQSDEENMENKLIELTHLLAINGWIDIETKGKIKLSILKDGFFGFYKQYSFECTAKVPIIPYQYQLSDNSY